MKWKEDKAKYEADNRKVETFVSNYKAKKDFKITHNEYVREIKQGDDLSDVPAIYHENLKTEQVI